MVTIRKKAKTGSRRSKRKPTRRRGFIARALWWIHNWLGELPPLTSFFAFLIYDAIQFVLLGLALQLLSKPLMPADNPDGPGKAILFFFKNIAIIVAGVGYIVASARRLIELFRRDSQIARIPAKSESVLTE